MWSVSFYGPVAQPITIFSKHMSSLVQDGSNERSITSIQLDWYKRPSHCKLVAAYSPIISDWDYMLLQLLRSWCWSTSDLSALEHSTNLSTHSNKWLARNDQLMTRELYVKVEQGQLLRLSCGFLWRPTTSTTSMLTLATHSLVSEDPVTWTLVSTLLTSNTKSIHGKQCCMIQNCFL